MTAQLDLAIVSQPRNEYDGSTFEDIVESIRQAHPCIRRSHAVRAILATILAPFVLTLGMFLLVVYPSPAELVAAFKPQQTEVRTVEGGGPLVETVIRDLSSVPATEGLAERSEDCFTGLAIADRAKLDRCAVVVYTALAEVERNASNPNVRNSLAVADQSRLTAKLKLAATEVCRITWAKDRDNRFGFDTPPCQAAELTLASDIR